jgi:hypothetical protein
MVSETTPSMTVSFASTSIVEVVPWTMVQASSTATGGASSTGVTVTVTTAVSVSPAWPFARVSVTRYVNVSTPNQSGAGE